METNLGHLMVDLESFGTKSKSAISSIGAVEFDLATGAIGRQFYQTINIQSCMDLGLGLDGQTIYWWLGQSEESRMALLQNNKNIREVLFEFRKFIQTLGVSELMVWGNGSRFDLGLLHDAYDVCRKESIPWNFRNERDVRTYIMDHLEIKDLTERIGTQHHPVDDCLHQISYCSKVYLLKNQK